MIVHRALGRAGMRLLRWMDRRWILGSVLLGLVLSMVLGIGRWGRTSVELGVPLVLGVLTVLAAVIGGRADREERHEAARYEAFLRSLDARERRDAAVSAPDRSK